MAPTRPKNQAVKLTKTVIDRAVIPTVGQAFLRDTELKGFGLRITPNGVKSFIVEKRISGRNRRQTLGRYGELTCEQARRLAHKHLGQIAMGIDVIAERERARLERTTLGQAFEDYLSSRKSLSPKTRYDYGRFRDKAFENWLSRPLTSIHGSDCLEKHRKLGDDHGERYANLGFQILRAVFNDAIDRYQDASGHPLLIQNPVLKLTRLRVWFRDERRQTVVKFHQLPAWYQGVMSLRGKDVDKRCADAITDLLLFLVFTGLRRSEAIGLTWDRVDLEDRSLHIPHPKNRVPFTLPLSDYLVKLLLRRREVAKCGYVFPGEGPKGYLIEPKRPVQKVIDASGVQFSLHDLRRTFITVAESLDVRPYTLKRLVNHKMSNDVTFGYIVSDLERLRMPMQNITDYLRRAMKMDGEYNICSIVEGAPVASLG